ncbi:MAG: hypothetical protein KC438_07800 [Thermomicrobiales bacterium]|nr:hypothetical protein [Thermomicrobiales bacterium]MCO5222466.1 hypothetical protein [Thermomicrobiales bacterium]
MFSPNEIDHIAWFLVLLMGAWLVVNALVDLSAGRKPSLRKRSERSNDKQLDGQGD